MKPPLAKCLLLSIAIAGTTMSCQKEQDVQPVAQTATISSDVQVVSGRLVFSDQKAFERTRSALEKQMAQSTGSQALDKWEEDVHFSSLRALAASQGSHLEELDAQKQPTAAYDMMQSFGFPAFYASLINPAGEYQIGNKVYWFHNGFKYEAASQEELATIKQNPLAAKFKYAAGAKLIKSTQIPLGGATNRTVGSRNPQDDYKYHYEFNLNNDPGSQRRIMYNIRIYVEDRGRDQGNYSHQFYTNLSLLIKYEYYNNYYGSWYPSQGRGSQLDWTTGIDFTGTPLTPNPLSTPQSYTSSSYRTFSFDNGVVGISLGDATIYANVAFQDYTADDVTWDYQINGGITAYPDNDRNHRYNVSGYPLW